MEANAALVWADGIVELHAVAQIDVDLTVVVDPRHAEGDDTVGLDQPFNQLGPLKLGVLVIHVLNRKKHLTHGLQILVFAGVTGFKSRHDLLCFHRSWVGFWINASNIANPAQ